MNNDAELLTVREAAHRLRQSEATVRRKIHEGELLAVRVGQGSPAPLRVPSGYLDRWLYSRGKD
jgi:excisionase family DNA binding protein